MKEPGTDETARCPYCAEVYSIEWLEIYPEERSFQLITCCEGAQEEIACEFAQDRGPSKSGAIWLNALGWETYTGAAARSVYVTGEGHLEVDERLRLQSVTLADAQAFIGRHHRHNAPPVGWRFGMARAPHPGRRSSSP